MMLEEKSNKSSPAVSPNQSLRNSVTSKSSANSGYLSYRNMGSVRSTKQTSQKDLKNILLSDEKKDVVPSLDLFKENCNLKLALKQKNVEYLKF